MLYKIQKIVFLLSLSLIAFGCSIYLKPSPKKIESRKPHSLYNFYKYYAAEFEGQIGKGEHGMIHFGLNYLDSSYWMRITNFGSIHPTEQLFSGK